METWRSPSHRLRLERLVRWSLGAVYLWFCALKLVDASPVLDLVRRAYPSLASVPLFIGLGLFELALGIALLSGCRLRWTAGAVVFHLLGLLGVLVLRRRRPSCDVGFIATALQPAGGRG